MSGDLSNNRITLVIESDRKHLALVRSALRGLSQELQVTDRARHRIELCVVEAVSNSIEHAYRNQSGQPIMIEWIEHDGHLQLAVCDKGLSMDSGRLELIHPTMIEIDPSNPATLKARGRGLILIKTFMDEVAYHTQDGWNRLEMQLGWHDGHPMAPT